MEAAGAPSPRGEPRCSMPPRNVLPAAAPHTTPRAVRLLSPERPPGPSFFCFFLSLEPLTVASAWRASSSLCCPLRAMPKPMLGGMRGRLGTATPRASRRASSHAFLDFASRPCAPASHAPRRTSQLGADRGGGATKRRRSASVTEMSTHRSAPPLAACPPAWRKPRRQQRQQLAGHTVAGRGRHGAAESQLPRRRPLQPLIATARGGRQTPGSPQQVLTRWRGLLPHCPRPGACCRRQKGSRQVGDGPVPGAAPAPAPHHALLHGHGPWQPF